jgi:hypothetical protein
MWRSCNDIATARLVMSLPVQLLGLLIGSNLEIWSTARMSCDATIPVGEFGMCLCFAG